jgi:hypothetical protein
LFLPVEIWCKERRLQGLKPGGAESNAWGLKPPPPEDRGAGIKACLRQAGQRYMKKLDVVKDRVTSPGKREAVGSIPTRKVAGLLGVEAGDRVVVSNVGGKFPIHGLQPRFAN